MNAQQVEYSIETFIVPEPAAVDMEVADHQMLVAVAAHVAVDATEMMAHRPITQKRDGAQTDPVLVRRIERVVDYTVVDDDWTGKTL